MILDGKAVSQSILEACAPEAANLKPSLAVILVGNNPASEIYVRNKEKSCAIANVESITIKLPDTITQDELLSEIDKLNNDPQIDGFIVQMPLPEHINAPEIFKAINPHKDVDGFTAYNMGKMFLSPDFEQLPPATPGGIIKMLEHYKIDVKGKEVVVVGHSNIVGKPIGTMLLNRDATVTTCHIHTKDLKSHTQRADIIIVAAGVPNLITADMVKDGVVVIDVGINKTDDGICGDVDFEAVKEKASYISPVPGGVGPMTVASLVYNTLTAAKLYRGE